MSSSGIVRKLERYRNGLRVSMSLQRTNAIRYVAGHPGRTSAEIAEAIGGRSQGVGQMLTKAYEVRRDEQGRWYLRHWKPAGGKR